MIKRWKSQSIPKVLTEEELNNFYVVINTKAITSFRNFCMFRMMANLGLRVSEVTNLKIENINWMSGKVLIQRSKNNRDRILWLNEDDLDLLREWRERSPVQSEYLFTTLNCRRVHDSYLRQVVKRLVRRAGLPRNIHPHTFRHTFATDLYRARKDIRLVQKALGHSDISTTMIYTHIVDDELEEALKMFRVTNAPL